MHAIIAAAVTVAVAFGQDSAHARSFGEPWFEVITNLEGEAQSVEAWGISGSGEVVFGAIHTGTSWEGLIWTRAQGAVALGGQVVFDSDFAGSRFAGGRAGIYTVGSGWQTLGTAPGSTDLMYAAGISPDGQTVVGYAPVNSDEFSAIWTPAEGPRMLRRDDEELGKWVAIRTSNNADVILTIEWWSFRTSWVLRDGVRTQLPASAVGPGDMTPDGAIIVGGSQHSRWFFTPPIGVQSIPDGPCDRGGASRTDARGGYIVGSTGENCPFIYDRFHGTRDLVQLMEQDFGLDLGGVEILQVWGISDDGRSICGRGVLNRVACSWVAYLPLLRCPGDFNADDQLDFYDVQQYLIAFSQGDPTADVVPDEVLNFFDVAAFLDRYAFGCL